MFPEISPALQDDLVMIVGSVTGLLFVVWIANRILWAYSNYRNAYGQQPGHHPHHPGGGYS